MNEKIIIGKIWKDWEIIDCLGRGTFGSVYKAKRNIMGTDYYTAIKVIKIPDTQKAYIEKIEKEAAMMYQMRDYGCIVRIEDYHIQPVEEYREIWLLIQMELMQGSMEEWLEQISRPFDSSYVVKVMEELCTELRKIHKAGIVHRDIKPANILMNELGRYKYGDLGGAKYIEDIQGMTSSFGTLNYAAPEVIYGKEYNKTIDIYSLGLIMYQLLNEGKKLSVENRLRSNHIPKPALADDVLWSIIQKACAYEKEERFQNADEMIDALKDWKARSIDIFAQIKEKAEAGDVEAQSILAICYRYGLNGVEQDVEQTVKWGILSAEHGDALSMYWLAERYNQGDGVEENKERAFDWYKKAAEQGHDLAQYELGKRYDRGEGVEEDTALAFGWYKKAAEQGVVLAQYELAERYDRGEGIEKNDAEAFKWYKRAAQQKYSPAYYKLARKYDKGDGTVKNKKEAVKWYEKSAQTGDDDAIYQLAKMYAKGEYVSADDSKAAELYRQAAKRGNVSSKAELLYRYVMKEETADRKTLEDYYEEFAGNRELNTQVILKLMRAMVVLYKEEDPEEANEWYKKVQ